ncbi:Ceramide glucosyltransferase [Meyerozyma sp. JA9]|nr:Ceramide glucosyltransferase [Meyerozyma sp. JA9]
MFNLSFREASAIFLLIWYIVILVAAYSGFFALVTRFRKSPNYPLNERDMEPVSIIRPLKGIEPEMYSCLESSFLQNYPLSNFEILFCVDDTNDAAIPVVQSLIQRYPRVSAQILVSEHDPQTHQSTQHFGPNPKVNNLAKGFRAAKHDILWVMDSNVWASPNVLRNSVKALNYNTNNGVPVSGSRRNKLVHHVPLAVSVSPQETVGEAAATLASANLGDFAEPKFSKFPNSFSSSSSPASSSASSSSSIAQLPHTQHSTGPSAGQSTPAGRRLLKKFGAKLDEMFLLTSHSKFYVSLNNLAVAPCVNGKSNIYRRSDLDLAVAAIPIRHSAFFNTPAVRNDALQLTREAAPGNSIKFFSKYIGEDNMIGIALWENLHGRTGLTSDVVIQPLSGTDNTVGNYVERRVRWLRVRKYMVLAATLIEPTTESIICGVYGTYAVSTVFFNQWFNWKYFAFHMAVWILTDYCQYYTLVHNIAGFDNPPKWLAKHNLPPLKRRFFTWIQVWWMRELLALPIWVSAMYGHEIDWRGRPFKIKPDLSAEEL